MLNFWVKVQKWLLVLIGIPIFCLAFSHNAQASIISSSSNVGASTCVPPANGSSDCPSNFPVFSGSVSATGVAPSYFAVYVTSLNNPTADEAFFVEDNNAQRCKSLHNTNWVLGWNYFPCSDLSSPFGVGATTTAAAVFAQVNNTQNEFALDTAGNIIYALFDNSTSTPPLVDNTTHFISTTPVAGSVVSTTTVIGYIVNVNPNDYSSGESVQILLLQQAYVTCATSYALYKDICASVQGEKNTASTSITIDNVYTGITGSGANNFSSTTFTFPSGGEWQATYNLRQSHFFGLWYSVLKTTSTTFVVGATSTLDQLFADNRAAAIAQASSTNDLIRRAIASSTAELALSCNPFSGGFSPGDCLLGVIWPGQDSINDDLLQLTQLPPWGYVFRFMDIVKNTAATTTLPAIAYTFASTSPLAASVGTISFDPFGLIAQSGTIIDSYHSDQDGTSTVWDVLMPFINIFIYLVLAVIIIQDLTGIHTGTESSGGSSKEGGFKVSDEAYRYKEKLYEMSKK